MSVVCAWRQPIQVNARVLEHLDRFDKEGPTSSTSIPAYTPLELPHIDFNLMGQLSDLGCTPKTMDSLAARFDERKEELAASCRAAHESMWEKLCEADPTRLSDYCAATACLIRQNFARSVDYLRAAILEEVQQLRDTQLLLLSEQRSASTPSTPHVTHASKIKTDFTAERVDLLEAVFADKPVLTAADRNALAHATGLEPRQVATWFANARTRRGLTGSALVVASILDSSDDDDDPPPRPIRKASSSAAPYPTSIKVTQARSLRTVSSASSSTGSVDDGSAITRSRNSSGRSLITYEEEEAMSGEEGNPLSAMEVLVLAGAYETGGKEQQVDSNPVHISTPSDSGMTVEEMLEGVAESIAGGIDVGEGAISEMAMDNLVGASTNRQSSAVFSPNAHANSVYSPYSPLSSLAPSPVISGHPDSPSSHLEYSPTPSSVHSEYLPPPSLSPSLHIPSFQRRPTFLNGLDLTIDRIDQTFWNSILDDDPSTTGRTARGSATVDLTGGITLAMDEDYEMN